MTHQYINDGNPLPQGHPDTLQGHSDRVGQLGVEIDFEDGSPKQYIYAADHRAMSEKVLGMYGNTRERNRQLKTEVDTLKAQPGQPPKPAAPTTEPETDAAWIARKRKEDEQKGKAKQLETYRREQVDLFIAECPAYVGSKRNGELLRDRAMRLAAGKEVTAQNYVAAYHQLLEAGLLESAPEQQINQPETPQEQPSATPPVQRPAGTGLPPSTFGGGRPSTPKRMNYEDYTALPPSEFERRMRHEPGFADAVNRAAAERAK